MPSCKTCGRPLRQEMTLSLGALSACNRFELPGREAIETHPLSISQCDHCDLVQLSSFPPVDFVRPRVPWIRYNEPAAHLDAVVERLLGLMPSDQPSAMGVGPFEGPLLERLEKRGVGCIELDLSGRWHVEPGSFPYLETIQKSLNPEILVEVASNQGVADLVSCRYLLEHCHDPVLALQGLRHLSKPGGVLLVEVPDGTKFISNMDYSFIWEEHICYFTEDTFRTTASRAGFEVVAFFRYPSALEDALVFLLRERPAISGDKAPSVRRGRTDNFQRFLAGFEGVRATYAKALESIVDQGRKVVVFGAGHQSIMFVNALRLQRYVSFLIDDSRDKIGYLVPGTGIEIVSSEKLTRDPTIGVCLLGVAPAAESKIRAKYASYIASGGQMYSIFPAAGTGTLIGRHDRE